MILKQIAIGKMAVFCYLIGDEVNGTGALIDPAGDFDRISGFINKHNLTIKYIINTHGHIDHTCGNAQAVKNTGAKILIHEADRKKLESVFNRMLSRIICGGASPSAEIFVKDGDIISIGDINLRVIQTPGHTEGGICLYTEGHLFTGDTLFTEGFGRTDLPGGSYKKLADSIINKILTLPDDTVIWPGHNYGRNPSSTVREQKRIYMHGLQLH